MITVTVHGTGAAIQKLERVRTGSRNRVLRKGLTAASQIGARVNKGYVPRELKLLRRAIGYKVKVTKKGDVVGIVGARRRMGKVQSRPSRWGKSPVFHLPTKYAHLQNNGVKPHDILMPNGRIIKHPGNKKLAFQELSAVASISQASQAFISVASGEVFRILR